MQASFLTNASDGFIAGLDVRVKLLLCLMGSIVSIALSSPLSLGLLALLTTPLALGAARPTIVFKLYIINIFMFIFAIVFSALIGLAVPNLVRWNIFSMAVPFLRMIISINLLIALALSTPVQLLFDRLQNLRLPSWLFIPLSVAIRFIPTFIDDCAQIRDAARLRSGKGLSGLYRLFGLWRGLLVPLAFRMLHSADDLAAAAELKGIGVASRYGGRVQPKLSIRDWLVLALAAWAILIAVVLQKFGPQFQSMPM